MKRDASTSKLSGAFAFVLFALLAGSLSACSSGDKADPDAEEELTVDDDAGLQGGLQGSQGGSAQGGNNTGNGEGGGQNAQENSNSQSAEEKTPISEDGYDDDWNNLNSQQQKANNNKNNNKKNQLADDEPPLENANQFGQEQQTAPQQQVAEEPPVQQYSQIPAEEPPMDVEPAPVAMNPEPLPEPEPALAPAPEVAAPLAPVVSGAPLIKQDVEPVFALLHWVGYDYMERDSVVRVEIVTRGSPRYNLFQERNKADQPELVIRFFNTRLRPKVRRDIDASEFRSPVAYVRMRPDEIENSVDVIITMRDAVKPRMYSKYGNILLTFAIPDHYFGNAAIGSAPIAKAEVMANANIMPDLDTESEIPEGLKIAKAFVNNPGKDALGEVPNDAGQPVDTEALPVTNTAPVNTEAVPADFTNTPEDLNFPSQNTAVNNFGSGNNFANNTNGGNFTNGNNAEQFDDESEQQNSGNDQEEFDDFQGESANANFQGGQGQGTNEFNFGGGQGDGAPAQGGNFTDSELNGTSDGGEFENTGEELDEDSLNNFENDGGSQEEIDKFDVRRSRGTMLPELLIAGFIVSQVSINAVAQDDFGNQGFGNQQAGNQQAGNQSDDGEFSQGGDPELGNVAANGNIEDASFGGNQSQGQNAGEGNFGNTGGQQSNFGNTGGQQSNFGNTGGNNFGGNNTGNGADDDFLGGNGNNAEFGNTANANAFPSANSGNVTNTTLSNGNAGGNAGTFNASGNTTGAISNVPANNTSGTFIDNTAAEPAMDGSPDLAGPESEGSEDEYASETSSGGGRKIKLDFRDAPIGDVIRVLGEESGVNFILAPGVSGGSQGGGGGGGGGRSGRVTINLDGVPFNDALKALLSSQRLGMVEISPNVIKIDTLENIAKDKKDIEAARKDELKSRPTKVLVHRLSYIKSKDAAASIEPMLKAAADGDTRFSIKDDFRSNSVIINGIPELLSLAKTLLERLDFETPQVRIASRIVEVLKIATADFGVSWGSPFNYDQGRGLGFGNLTFPNYMLSRYTVDAGGTTQRAGNGQFRFGSINNVMALDLALSMEEAKGTTEILQSNDVTVEDNTKATIEAGGEETLAVPTATGGIGTEKVNYKLGLIVTPHVTSDGSVQMELEIETSEPTAPQNARSLAAINRKTLKTWLLKRSGETAVIGGVYNSKTEQTVTGVPFLSRIPIIGALFRSKSNKDSKRELLIMVTPTILPAIGKFGGGGGEPESVSLNAGSNANFNTQLNNTQNFNSDNEDNSNFDSNSQGNFNNNGGGNNNNNGGNQQSNNQQSNNQQSNNQQSNNQQSQNAEDDDE